MTAVRLKAFARVWLVLFAGFPIQRWLGVLAVASLPLAVAGLLLGPLLGRVLFAALATFATLAINSYLVASVFAAGYLFRVLSGPSAHRFLPHFRGTALAAFMTVAVLTNAPVLAAFVLMRNEARWVMAVPLLAVNLPLIAPFVPTVALPLGGLLLMAGFAVLGPWSNLRGGHTPEAIAVVLVAVGLVAMWSAFAVWYLRAPPFGRFRWQAALDGGKLGRRLSDMSGEFDGGSAVMSVLTSQYPARWQHRVAAFAILALIPFLASRMMRWNAEVGRVTTTLVAAMIILPCLFAPLGNLVVRRARRLWLRRGNSRAELFAMTERELWRMSVFNLGIVALFFFMFSLRSLSPGVVARDAGLACTAGIFATYIGLMWIRGARALDLLAVVFLLVTTITGIAYTVFAPERTAVLFAVGAVQLVAALAARAVARHRWRRIDWLELRLRSMPRLRWNV